MRRAVLLGVLLILGLVSVAPTAEPVRVLFVHHSTGGNLLHGGDVREGLAALGYELWDHGYNDEGLSDAEGNPTGQSFALPDDNTNPDGWAAIFAQEVASPPETTFARMLEYDVILFKSCFPASNITDDEMAANYKAWYLEVRTAIDQHPDRLFVVFTTPPLVPNETDLANAARARAWADYLTSDEYIGERTNVAVFDFFSLLADASGVLRAEYRSDAWDSHPNDLANQTIGPLLVAFVDAAIVRWQSAR